MATFQVNYCSKQIGLTLIEVLIALAIIAIAMTAVIKAVSQSIRSVTYLQDKTIALWVGENVLNELRVGLIKLSDADETKKKVEMLGREWYTQVTSEETPNIHIKKISAKVSNVELDSETDPIIELESYLYVQGST